MVGFASFYQKECSHGLTRTPYHMSDNCREPGPNHKRKATFTNPMGGTDYKCHLANSTTQGDDQSNSGS